MKVPSALPRKILPRRQDHRSTNDGHNILLFGQCHDTARRIYTCTDSDKTERKRFSANGLRPIQKLTMHTRSHIITMTAKSNELPSEGFEFAEELSSAPLGVYVV